MNRLFTALTDKGTELLYCDGYSQDILVPNHPDLAIRFNSLKDWKSMILLEEPAIVEDRWSKPLLQRLVEEFLDEYQKDHVFRIQFYDVSGARTWILGDETDYILVMWKNEVGAYSFAKVSY